MRLSRPLIFTFSPQCSVSTHTHDYVLASFSRGQTTLLSVWALHQPTQHVCVYTCKCARMYVHVCMMHILNSDLTLPHPNTQTSPLSTHTHMHSHTHARTHTHTHAHAHTSTHTHTHTHTHTQVTHTQAHSHTHTHTLHVSHLSHTGGGGRGGHTGGVHCTHSVTHTQRQSHSHTHLHVSLVPWWWRAWGGPGGVPAGLSGATEKDLHHIDGLDDVL